MNLKLNNKQLKTIGVNSLKNGNIPSIRNLITGNKSFVRENNYKFWTKKNLFQ